MQTSACGCLVPRVVVEPPVEAVQAEWPRAQPSVARDNLLGRLMAEHEKLFIEIRLAARRPWEPADEIRQLLVQHPVDGRLDFAGAGAAGGLAGGTSRCAPDGG